MTTTATTLDTRPLFPLLAAQQERVLGILAGLDEDDLRRSVLPSGWSFVGLVQHLTLMTRFWFTDVLTGDLADHPEDEFAVDPDRTAAEVLDTYARETATSLARVRELPLDTPPAWWPEGRWGGWRLDSLFELVQHVLVETACHAGHLDAARELLDGRTWDYAQGRLADPV